MYPSRDHITDMFRSLITNEKIEDDDNIVIYYAGHGSCYHDAIDNVFIEALCPIDRDTLGTNGKPIPDISDREVNGYLTQISLAKGHQITFIVDCCHSASVSREVPPQGARTYHGTERATLRDMLYAGDKLLRDRPGIAPF